jgi:hypothetical protein
MPLTQEVKDRLQSLYAGRHKLFLANHHPNAYAEMQKERSLEDYLVRIGTEAAEAHELMKDQMLAKAEEISGPSEKARYLNSIVLVVEEMVNAEIVYAKQS